MSGPTPGPWVVVDDGPGCRFVKVNGRLVACVGSNFTTVPQRDADAKLIAAAPDLAEALQGYLEQHSAAWRNFNDVEGVEHCPCRACVTARAALAKAGL